MANDRNNFVHIFPSGTDQKLTIFTSTVGGWWIPSNFPFSFHQWWPCCCNTLLILIHWWFSLTNHWWTGWSWLLYSMFPQYHLYDQCYWTLHNPSDTIRYSIFLSSMVVHLRFGGVGFYTWNRDQSSPCIRLIGLGFQNYRNRPWFKHLEHGSGV